MQKSLFNCSLNLFVVFFVWRSAISILNSWRSLSDRVLKVLDLFMCWTDVFRAIKLLEIEWLEHEASVVVLTFKLNSRFLQKLMSRWIWSSHLIGGHEVDSQGNSLESHFRVSFWIYSSRSGRKVDSWDKSYPNLIFVGLLNESNVIFERTTVFNSYPLVLSYFVVFGLVNLEDYLHLFCRHKFYALENEVQPWNSLSHMDLFESFDKHKSFCRVWARARQDR